MPNDYRFHDADIGSFDERLRYNHGADELHLRNVNLYVRRDDHGHDPDDALAWLCDLDQPRLHEHIDNNNIHYRHDRHNRDDNWDNDRRFDDDSCTNRAGNDLDGNKRRGRR